MKNEQTILIKTTKITKTQNKINNAVNIQNMTDSNNHILNGEFKLIYKILEYLVYFCTLAI